jgi:hypothetical protein
MLLFYNGWPDSAMSLGKNMCKIIILIFLVTFPLNIFATQEIEPPINRLSISGVLPSPYNSFSLEIETHLSADKGVKEFSLLRGNTKIEMSEVLKRELKNLKLTTLSISHMMHRDSPNSSTSIFGDDLYLRFKIGEYYPASKHINGKHFVKWGQDTVILRVDLAGIINVTRTTVKDTHDEWKPYPRLCSEIKPITKGWECQ